MGYSRLEPGRELEVRECISFQRGRDGFCELIECSVDELLERKAESTRTRSVSKGRSGSSSVNYQQTGRELMTPDEVRALDNDHCILFIRGELPVMDRKYDILKHSGLKLTEDGGAAPYIHRPGLTYALEDLPLSTDSWESIEIIE